MNTYSFRRFVSFLNLACLCLTVASGSSWAQSSQTTIYYNHETPQLQFAASEVRAAVAAKSGRLVERALSEFNYRERVAAKQAMNQTTPLQVADELAGYAQATLRELSALRASQGQSKELRLTLGDMEAMAHLGDYYAEKIRGATALALYDLNGKSDDKAEAIRHLESALAHWRSYAAVYGAQYKPQLLNRVGYVDIPALTTKVASDIEMARNWKPGTIKLSEVKRNSADNPFKP